jgi:hypothetical protein
MPTKHNDKKHRKRSLDLFYRNNMAGQPKAEAEKLQRVGNIFNSYLMKKSLFQAFAGAKLNSPEKVLGGATEKTWTNYRRKGGGTVPVHTDNGDDATGFEDDTVYI